MSVSLSVSYPKLYFKLNTTTTRDELFRRLSWSLLTILILSAIGWGGWKAFDLLAPKTVYVRFSIETPEQASYYLKIGAKLHESPWNTGTVFLPAEANKRKDSRYKTHVMTPWFNLAELPKAKLHKSLNRAGGKSELPNVILQIYGLENFNPKKLIIELATQKGEKKSIEKRMEETFNGNWTSFLVSPTLQLDASELETASEMTERHLEWAKAISGNEMVTPEKLIIQTSLWGKQREELNEKEAQVLKYLGFNTVSSTIDKFHELYGFRKPVHSHAIKVSPALTNEDAYQLMKDLLLPNQKGKRKVIPQKGTPFNFSDELVCRPPIGKDSAAITHFHQWLSDNQISANELGVDSLSAVVPIETPNDLRERQVKEKQFANRIFYYTSRFRQEKATSLLRQYTVSLHQLAGASMVSSTLIADHPYFSGTGLGMGMTPNMAWGGSPLALDWFDIGRREAVDLIGIEDWLGLQYMYGPNYTWEGFQLLGFQAAIFRSASQGKLPIITWITPSDEKNLRLKASSALCQGAKHFYFWSYGPTSMSTENYWSDLKGEYYGLVDITRRLAKTEDIIAPGHTRKTKVAILYSISSDLWQPFGYQHMLERRGLYFSLIHGQYLVDFLSEEDVEAGRLSDYEVLYTADPCIKTSAVTKIDDWVRNGGLLYGTCMAGSRNEFGEEVDGLSNVFGITPKPKATLQKGKYRIRGELNQLEYLDKVKTEYVEIGVVGMKVDFAPLKSTEVKGRFNNGRPALVINKYGSGKAVYAGTTPGISYIKDANFAKKGLREKWPTNPRIFINHWVNHIKPLVKLSAPVVETGIFETSNATALILANFTYIQIPNLQVSINVKQRPSAVTSTEHGGVSFNLSKSDNKTYPYKVDFVLPLDLNDIIMIK
ncbi:beta-galactosidase trimerization domain-containing protein [Limibacter armeniacum]|uniref:beta-galactosidase trimerization domain-containing protein n=1 Tax=Limibacter armeniacum TaxID=466084 RepID=UPI002FE6A3F4